MPTGAPSSARDPEQGVVWPLGRLRTLPSSLAPRLSDLDARRIALVWDHVFRGDDMFAVFADEVARHHPDAGFVGHEPFGNVHGNAEEEHEAIAHLVERLRANKVDAVVVGVGA